MTQKYVHLFVLFLSLTNAADPLCQNYQKQNNNCFPNNCNLADTNNANLCSTIDVKCCSSYYTKDSTTGDAYFKDCRDHIAPCTIQNTDNFIMNNNCMDDSYTNIDMDKFAIAGVINGTTKNLSIIKTIDTNDDIQTEINSITTEQGYIILKEGNYTITDTISLSKSNVVLRGIKKETTIIKVNFGSTDADKKYAIDIPDGVTYSGLEDITIKYIKLLPTQPKECPDGFGGCKDYPVYSLFYKNDYPNDMTGGIQISGDNCWLSNVEVNIIGKNPLYIPPTSEHVTITDCTFSRSYNKDGGKGYIDLRGGNILYKNNIATKLRHLAITRDAAKYNVVYNNYFEIDVNFHTKDAGYNLIENNNISTPRWHKWTGQLVTGTPISNHWPPGPYNIIYNVTGEARLGYNNGIAGNIFQDGKIYTYDYSIAVTANITGVCANNNPANITVKQCMEQGYIPNKYASPAATNLAEPICKTFYPIIQLPKEIIFESVNSWSFEYPLGEICGDDTWIREFEIDIIAKPDSRNDASLQLFFGTSSQCFIIVIDYDNDEKIIIAPANSNNLKSISGTIDTSIIPVKTSTEYGTLAENSDNMSSNKSPIKLNVAATRTDTTDFTIGFTTVRLTKNGVSKSVTYTNTFDKNKNLYLYLSTYQNHKFQLDNIEDTTTTCQSSVWDVEPFWYDDFSGTSLDTNKWSYKSSIGSNEAQHYETNSVVVNNGLTIESFYSVSGGSNFQSGGIISTKEFKYPIKIEISMKLPDYNLIYPTVHPHIYLRDSDSVGTQPRCYQQYDIMGQYNDHKNNKIYAKYKFNKVGTTWSTYKDCGNQETTYLPTINDYLFMSYRNSNNNYQYYPMDNDPLNRNPPGWSNNGNGFSDDYHKFTFEWLENSYITLKMDDRIISQVTSNDGVYMPFQPMKLYISMPVLAQTHTYDGADSIDWAQNDASVKKKFDIEYIKVYSKPGVTPYIPSPPPAGKAIHHELLSKNIINDNNGYFYGLSNILIIFILTFIFIFMLCIMIASAIYIYKNIFKNKIGNIKYAKVTFDEKSDCNEI